MANGIEINEIEFRIKSKKTNNSVYDTVGGGELFSFTGHFG